MRAGTRKGAIRAGTPGPEHTAPGDPGALADSIRATAFMRAPEAMLITRLRDGLILDANLAFESALGFTREEAIGRTTTELDLFVLASDREAIIAEILSEGSVLHRSFPLRLKDGSVHTGIVSFSQAALGDEPCLVSTLYSVTEQDIAGEALVRSEARYRRLFEGAGDAIFILRDDLFVDCNLRALEMFRCAREAILGHPPFEFSPPFQPNGRDSQSEALAHVHAALGGTAQHFEWTHRRADGTDFPAEVSLVTLDLPTGRYLQAIVRDITERWRAALDLARSEEKYRLLAENVADVIWTMDLGMRVSYVSPSVQKMHGGKPEEWVGRGLEQIVVPEAVSRVVATIEREMSEHGGPDGDPHRVVTIEVEQVRLDGTRFWTEVTARLMRDPSGTPNGIIGATRDISERRQAEAERRRLEEQLMQAQKLESVGRLAGGVAHDFNNMLTPILGHAELLRNELPPGDPRHSRVQEMLSAAERCRDLVQRLLAFARKQTFALRPLDMNEVARGFESILRRTLREDVRLELRLAPALGPIAGDRGQLEQILMNLAVNAQDAMPDGGTLTFETADEPGATPAGRQVRLEIRDSGAGMDDATRARVFEPFFTTKGPGHGTGLGLSTVFGIVEQHRGSIEVTSAPGEGTTFRMRFPCVEVGTVPDALGLRAETRNRGGGTVLVVEDEVQVRTLAVEVLRAAGHTVLAAGDTRAALELARAHPGVIDLLLTDVVLPDENGRVLYARLVNERPSLRVLYMSGYTADVIGHRGVLEPGMDFIQKPFSIGALAAQVAEVLARA